MSKNQNRNLLFLDQVVHSGMSFMLTILASRMLDIHHFGIFASLIIVLYLLLSTSQAIIVQPMQIMISKVADHNGYKKFLLLTLIGMVTLLSACVIFTYFLDLEILSLYQDSLLGYTFFIMAFLFHDFFRKFFLATDQISNAFVIDVISVLGQCIGLVYLISGEGITLNKLFLFLSISYLPSILLGLVKYSLDLRGKISSTFLGYHIAEGRWLLSTAIIQWFANNLFVISSGLFISVAALGALRLAQTVFGVFNIILQTVENYLIPYVNRIKQKSIGQCIIYLQSLCKKSVLVFALLSLPLILFSKSIMQIIGGSEYLPYHGVLIGLSILYLIIFAGYPVRISMRILELNKVLFKGYLLAFLVGLVSFQILLKNYALNGAIAGLILNQLIMIAVWQLALNKKQFYLWKSYT